LLQIAIDVKQGIRMRAGADTGMTALALACESGNLLPSILDTFNVCVDQFGNSTGRLEGV